MRNSLLFGVIWSAASCAMNLCAAESPASLGSIEDFDAASTGPYQKGFLDSWRWTEAVRTKAQTQSRLEVVDTPAGSGKSLRVRIDDPQLVATEPLTLLRMTPHYPPEADAIRIRLQVVSGEVSIHIGGPTAYYGNSDVYTEPQTLRAENPPRWIDVDFSLNHPTWRNFRRSGLSTDAPRNYYNRWAQEPVGVFIGAGSTGELLIDRIELLATGEGNRFPEFLPEQIRQVQTIVDFEAAEPDGDRPGDIARVFNLYMAAAEVEWFDESWKRSKPLRFPPMKLNVVDEGLDGKKSLACTGRIAEEVHCTGVRVAGNANANGFTATIKSTALSDRSTLFGFGPALPLDFFVFVASPCKPFDWERFGPSAELRAHVGPGFDYNFNHRMLQGVTDADFAIYQTRRFVRPGEWTKLVLPAADFTCIYGHGSYRRKLLDHEPLTCSEAIAVAWLSPWCRAGRREETDTTLIDQISFVKLEGASNSLRSYWQVPDVTRLISRDGEISGRKTRHIAIPQDAPASQTKRSAE